MKTAKDVSVIICAYNEESTVEDVVRACVNYNHESEVIVVDDGSTDKTPDILKKLSDELGIRNIRMTQNKGKSYAMAYGVEEASRDIILFWDADVTGIKEEHFKKILQPMFDEEADMVLGQPSETFIDYRINPFKGLTGERAILKKDIIPIIEDIREIAFGIETYINLYFKAHGKRIKYIIMDGLTHPTKYTKTSPVQATTELISEGQEIAVTLLQNYDLITKRIEYSFNSQNEKVKDKLIKMQKDVNERIKAFLGNENKRENEV